MYHENDIIDALRNTPRLNIVLTDVDAFTDPDFDYYKVFLEKLSEKVEALYVEDKTPQLNLLTDRMMLSQMNNCGAGETSITLAPNGKFYVCPAFYYEDENDSIGDLEHELNIKNKQLYQLDHAPICRHCDAWQCKRCIWLIFVWYLRLISTMFSLHKYHTFAPQTPYFCTINTMFGKKQSLR